jgi:acyl carrier protein
MNIERKDIIQILEKSLKEFCEEYDLICDLSNGENTKLFGGDGILDSLGLVSFIVVVEEAIEDNFNVSIILADEKAMSRRTSPFGKISYLADYIMEILNEGANA